MTLATSAIVAQKQDAVRAKVGKVGNQPGIPTQREKEKTWVETIVQPQLAVSFIQEDPGKECQHPAIAPNPYVCIPEGRNKIAITDEENLIVSI